MPPRPDELDGLRTADLKVKARAPSEKMHWCLDAVHPEWGAALVASMRLQPPPRFMEHAPELTPAEIRQAAQGIAGVSVRIDGAREHVLGDRKRLLRFLRALLGSDGLFAVDHLSTRFWSRAGLDDELAHDADPDVSALYGVHWVSRNEPGAAEPRIVWGHTHGLGAIGAFDFDILLPHADVPRRGDDVLRAAAYLVLEGRVQRDTPRCTLFQPGGDVRFVDAQRFMAAGPPDERALRDPAAEHDANRAVLCEPARGLLGRWSRRIVAARCLQRPISDEVLMQFSEDATQLMAARAVKTYGVLRALHAEFRECDLPVVVKIGYPCDGKPDEHEHLWFQVHELWDDTIDATLLNQPIAVRRLTVNARGTHPVDQLTDWTIVTPAGPITPRDMRAARMLREAPELLQAVKAAARFRGMQGTATERS